MKRSERFQMKARRTALWAGAIFSATAAAGVWSVRVWQECATGGVACMMLPLAGLLFFTAVLRVALRLARMSRTERRWEWEREVRPRL